eukprot:SAG11_NODE_231_length_11932_cov_40.992817_12_plen_144_part_00
MQGNSEVVASMPRRRRVCILTQYLQKKIKGLINDEKTRAGKGPDEEYVAPVTLKKSLDEYGVYTCMKTVIGGLFMPAVQRRMISDEELEEAGSLEEVLFTVGQRTLFASQDTAYCALGAYVPFMYELDVDLVCCHLIEQVGRT